MKQLLIFSIFICQSAFAQITMESLGQCPDSPNCVSSLSSQEDKKMMPFSWEKDTPAIEEIANWIKSQDRTEIIEQTDNSLHAVFTSRIFRFKDDVYFLYDASTKKVHFKSQSRVGYSDLGVNKKRMEHLIKQVNK